VMLDHQAARKFPHPSERAGTRVEEEGRMSIYEFYSGWVVRGACPDCGQPDGSEHAKDCIRLCRFGHDYDASTYRCRRCGASIMARYGSITPVPTPDPPKREVSARDLAVHRAVEIISRT